MLSMWRPRATHLGKTEIDKDAFSALIIPQKVGRFDIPMNDPSLVCVIQGTKETPKVLPDMRWIDIFVKQLTRRQKPELNDRQARSPIALFCWTYAKVIATMIWHDRDDLIL